MALECVCETLVEGENNIRTTFLNSATLWDIKLCAKGKIVHACDTKAQRGEKKYRSTRGGEWTLFF